MHEFTPLIWSRRGAGEPPPVQLYAVLCRSLHSAQRNVAVAESPVTFEVKNTATEAPVTIDLVAIVSATINGVPGSWPLSVTPSQVTLSADDPAAVITALFTVPNGVVIGVDSAIANIEAIARAPGGDVSLGGVRILDFGVTPVVPALSAWGIALTISLGMLFGVLRLLRPSRRSARGGGGTSHPTQE